MGIVGKPNQPPFSANRSPCLFKHNVRPSKASEQAKKKRRVQQQQAEQEARQEQERQVINIWQFVINCLCSA